MKNKKFEKMIAYHYDSQLKSDFITLLKWHQEQDKIIKGTYSDNPRNGLVTVAGFELPSKFRGCAVGCSINSLRAITGRTDIEFGSHVAYEELIGIPRILARLEDRLFENLSLELATAWPVRFADAIQVGADLSMVWSHFAYWLLVDELDGVIKFARNEQSKNAILKVAKLYQAQIAGKTITRKRWHAAAAAAAAASSYAAAAASYAAAASSYAAAAASSYAAAAAADRGNHYIKMADKLVELMANCVPLLSTAKIS